MPVPFRKQVSGAVRLLTPGRGGAPVARELLLHRLPFLEPIDQAGEAYHSIVRFAFSGLNFTLRRGSDIVDSGADLASIGVRSTQSEDRELWSCGETDWHAKGGRRRVSWTHTEILQAQ